jgi:hypothetical protein
MVDEFYQAGFVVTRLKQKILHKINHLPETRRALGGNLNIAANPRNRMLSTHRLLA